MPTLTESGDKMLITQSTYISSVKMLNVHWKHNGTDVVDWVSKTARERFFNEHDGEQMVNCKPVRSNVIKVPVQYDDTQMYNYCQIVTKVQDTEYYYYAFIVGRRYVNNNCTEIVVDIDSWVTYQFDIVWRPCLVNKAIVPKSTDIAGNFLCAEGVDYGSDYLYSNQEVLTKDGSNKCINTDWTPVAWVSSQEVASIDGQTYTDADGYTYSLHTTQVTATPSDWWRDFPDMPSSNWWKIGLNRDTADVSTTVMVSVTEAFDLVSTGNGETWSGTYKSGYSNCTKVGTKSTQGFSGAYPHWEIDGNTITIVFEDSYDSSEEISCNCYVSQTTSSYDSVSSCYCHIGGWTGSGYNGLSLVIFRGNGGGKTNSSNIRRILNGINIAQNGAVLSLVMMPKEAIYNTTGTRKDITASNLVSLTSKKSALFGGYTPKNNKLYTYPYCGMTLDTLSSGTQDFKLENFSTWGQCKFKVRYACTPNGGYAIYPLNYLGCNNLNQKISVNNFPTLSYSTDYYQSWLALQGGSEYLQATQDNKMELNEIEKNKMKTSLATNLIGSVGGAVAGTVASGAVGNVGGVATSIAGGVVSTATNVVNYNMDSDINAINKEQLALDYNATLSGARHTGNQAGLGNPSIDATVGFLSPYVYNFSIKPEFAINVDNHFSMYGYTVNRMTNPEGGVGTLGDLLSGRSEWNYLKTAGCNIWGNIPNDDIAKITNMFDAGCTIWHNYEHIYNYSYDNN